jgi:hypothetical protein
VSWLGEQIARSGLTRKAIARQLWPDSADSATTHPIKLYTEVRIVNGKPQVSLPAPETLRKLCDLLGLAWPEAFALAGYYRELLQALADLADLGYEWIATDCKDDPIAEGFHFNGVHELGGMYLEEALERPEYTQRYVIGSWEEGPFEDFDPPASPEGDQPEQSDFFQAWLRTNATQARCVTAVVPKPLAIAILVAVTGFPRRGDLYKDGISAYAAGLLRNASWLIDAAAEQSKSRRLPPLLQLADDALRDKHLMLEVKRVIAAEYVVAWADKQCAVYTHVARLAALARFGIAGSSVSTQNGEEILPDIRRALLPNADDFNQKQQEQN